MNFLDQIIADKRKELSKDRDRLTIKQLEEKPLFRAERPSFKTGIASPGPSVIAEFKRRSPSKGIINASARPGTVIPGYQQAGAAAVSVLTDSHFGGSLEDLEVAYTLTGLPLLRKDFIVDEYQVFQARSAGASAILLIGAALDARELSALASRAMSLDLDVLFEIHSEEDLQKCPQGVSIIGVNNRNLESFVVDTGISVGLANQIPASCLKVSESGLERADRVGDLVRAGYDAFLIGESFMRNHDPAEKARQFIEDLKVMKIQGYEG